MVFRNLIIVALLVLTSINVFAQDKIIKLVSDPYPPLVIDSPTDKGFVTEMAIKIFEDAGYKVVYINVPFKRALIGLDRLEYDGLLAVGPGRANYVYPENGFGESRTTFFVNKNSKWQYTGIESLATVTFGVINGYEYDGEFGGVLNKYIAKNKGNTDLIQETSGEIALESNIKKLQLGRIDVLAATPYVFWYTANSIGVADKFKPVGYLTPPGKITVGFNLNNPKAKEYAKIVSDGVTKLKASGDYDRIRNKYGIR